MKAGGQHNHHFCIIIRKIVFRYCARLHVRSYQQSQDLDAGIGYNLNVYRPVIAHTEASDGVIVSHLPELLELCVAIDFFKKRFEFLIPLGTDFQFHTPIKLL